MAELNYYGPLTTVNESEQKTLEKMQLAFNAAIGKSNIAQNNMISSYMATHERTHLDRALEGFAAVGRRHGVI